MSQQNDSGIKAFTAGAALAAHTLVNLSSGVLAACGLTEQPIGVLLEASFASGDIRPVKLMSAPGTIRVKTENAVAAMAVVYGRAAGVVDDSSAGSALKIGIALEAATAPGDVIEVMPWLGHI